MMRYIVLAVAALLVLEPLAAVAAPNPQQCMALRKRFDICESYQIQHHLPLSRCNTYRIALRNAGCR